MDARTCARHFSLARSAIKSLLTGLWIQKAAPASSSPLSLDSVHGVTSCEPIVCDRGLYRLRYHDGMHPKFWFSLAIQSRDADRILLLVQCCVDETGLCTWEHYRVSQGQEGYFLLHQMLYVAWPYLLGETPQVKRSDLGPLASMYFGMIASVLAWFAQLEE